MTYDLRKNYGNNKKIVGLILVFMFCIPTVNAAITNWTGPNQINSSGDEKIVNGFLVPGNATIRDGWVDVGVDGMVDADYGLYLSSVGTDFSNGTYDGTTLSHFGDLLSLLPDPTVNQMTDFETGLIYSRPGTLQSVGTDPGLWDITDLVFPTLTPTNGVYNLSFGEIPASTTNGSYLLGTNPNSYIRGEIYQSLELPAFLTPSNPNDFTLTFDHWYHFDTSSDVNGDGDGAWLEYRVDSGPWNYIEPEGGYTNTLNPELNELEFTLNGDYDGENSTINVYGTIPTNIPVIGQVITEEGLVANYTGFSGTTLNSIDQGNETPFNSSALNNTNITLSIIPESLPINGGVHGFPVWAGRNASGWVTSEFNLSNVSDIVNSNTLQFRWNFRTSNDSLERPGWYLDNVSITNSGVLNYDAWLFGCSPADGCNNPNGHYANRAGGSLVFPVDLSSATMDPSIYFEAHWALQGGNNGDNMYVEVSKDNISWEEVIAVGLSANPVPGSSSSGVPGDSQGFELLQYRYPPGYVGDSSTWFRIRVSTDNSLGCSFPQYSNHCGVFVNNLSIEDQNANIYFSDDFNNGDNGWHEEAPYGGFNPSGNLGIDEWSHVINSIGKYSFFDSFENPVPESAIGFEVELEITQGSEWEFGQIPTSYPGYGPVSFTSGDYGYGISLNGQASGSTFARLTTPMYSVVENASSFLSFNSWVCGEPNYDGGAVFISVNGSNFTHFHPTEIGGFNNTWYDGQITSPTADGWYPGINAFVGQGYGQTSGGGACNNHPGWEKMRGSLDEYQGSEVQFRFEYNSDGLWNYAAWYLDDLGIEVDYFLREGKWKSNLITLDDLGAGFLDATMNLPNETWIGASLLDSAGVVIPGFENLSFPFSIAGLDLDLYGDIHIELNFGTNDPNVSPTLSELFFGGIRSFDSNYYVNNGWDVPDIGIEVDELGNMTVSDGQTHILSSEFLYSSRPMKKFALTGVGDAVVTLKDINGNVLVNSSPNLNQIISLDEPQPGFSVEIELNPNDYLYYFYLIGYYVNPALNPVVDVLNDGVVDWEFQSETNVGHFGWQNRFYGYTESGVNTISDSKDRGMEFVFEENEINSVQSIIPANASIESALMSMIVNNIEYNLSNQNGLSHQSQHNFSANFSVTCLGQSTIVNIQNIGQQSVIQLPITGKLTNLNQIIEDNRLFNILDVELELLDSSINSNISIGIGPMSIGYDLVENITNLESVYDPYHQSSNDNGTATFVRYNLSYVSDRGGISLNGSVVHNLLITNEPFTPPSTFYPDGNVQTVTTTHFHSDNNNLIDSVRLTATSSNGDYIGVKVTDINGQKVFTQDIGSQFLSLIPAESSVELVDDLWVVNWSFTTQWDWDDQDEIIWNSLALDESGFGIAPYSAKSGGAGYKAVENDLTITDFSIIDQFGRQVLEDSWVKEDSILTVSGNVTFEDSLGKSPSSDAFHVITEINGVEFNMTSSDSGFWSGEVTAPNRSAGSIGTSVRYPISAEIIRVGPGEGISGANDETRVKPTVEFRLDDESPVAERLQIYTSGQYVDADGYTWDQSKEISLLFTVSDNQSLGSEVVMYYWIQDLHDLYDPSINGKNGVPDSVEYATTTVSLFNSGVAGEETLSFLPINLEVNSENNKFSVYFEFTDFAGNQIANGGGPGFESDYATIYTAINQPTEIISDYIYMNTEMEYLMVGQNHSFSMRIDEPNGIGTLEYVTVYLLGETEESLGVMSYFPVSNEFSTPLDSHLTINSVEVKPVDDSQFDLTFYFTLNWDFPEIAKGGWNLPSIVLEDTDPVTNPGTYDLVLTNIGTNRWSLDNELFVEIKNITDKTPPSTAGSPELLYAAEGDEISVKGVVKFANADEPIQVVPDDLLVNLDLNYGTEEVHSEMVVPEGGEFEISIILPGRSISDPRLPIQMSIEGIPNLGSDVTSQRWNEVLFQPMIVVDSKAPIISFGAVTFNNLNSNDLSSVLVTVIVNDEGGIADGPIEVYWAFTDGFGGSEIIGSRDSAFVKQASGSLDSGTTSWTYQETIDMRPNSGIRLSLGDGLKVWVVTKDLAGNIPLGTGTESQPRYVELDVESFVIEISEINVLPDDPYVGETLTISYLAKNIGTAEGEGNISLQFKNDFGNWTTVSSTIVALSNGQSFQPDPFLYEIGSNGNLELRIIVDGFESEAVPILGSGGSVINVESGERDEDSNLILLLGGGGAVLLGVIGLIIVLILRNKEDEFSIEEDIIEKQAPEVPTSNARQDNNTNQQLSHPDLNEAMEAFPSWGEEVLLQYLEAGWSVQQMKDEFYE